MIRGKDCAMYLTDKLKGAMFDPDYNPSPPTSYYERVPIIRALLDAPGN